MLGRLPPTVAEDDEEEELKRAIAMSLEQEEEEELSSSKGELLWNAKDTSEKIDCDKRFQLHRCC